MADYASARAAGIAAIDELDTWQGQPTLSSQLGSVATLQAQLDTANTQIASDAATIASIKTAAQADKTADAANLAGQGVLDAITAGGH